MKIHLMRSFAVAAGVSLWTAGVSDLTAADQGYDQRYAVQPSYQAPAKWNNFGRPSAPLPPSERSAEMPFGATFQSVAAHQQVEDLPSPVGEQQLPSDALEHGQAGTAPHSQTQVPAAPLTSSVHPHPFTETACQTCGDGTARITIKSVEPGGCGSLFAGAT